MPSHSTMMNGRPRRYSNATDSSLRNQGSIFPNPYTSSNRSSPSNCANPVVYYHRDVLPQQHAGHARSTSSYHSLQGSENRGDIRESREMKARTSQNSPNKSYHQGIQYSPPKRQPNCPPAQQSPTHRAPIPPITDVHTFSRAVHNSPEEMFFRLRQVIDERDSLRVQVSSLTESINKLRADYVSAKSGYERLNKIWIEKHLVLWKFIERIQAGEELGRVKRNEEDIAGGGEWIPREGTTSEDLESMSKYPTPSGVARSESRGPASLTSNDEERRGRNRQAKRPLTTESEVIIKRDEDGSTSASVAESVGAQSGGAVSTLDPGAKPFEPSPTRETTQRRPSTSYLPHLAVNTEIPIFCVTTDPFIDTSPSLEQPNDNNGVLEPRPNPPLENPWIQVKSRKAEALEAQATKRDQCKLSVKPEDSSRESSRIRGNKKKKKKKYSRVNKQATYKAIDQDWRKDSNETLVTPTQTGAVSLHNDTDEKTKVDEVYLTPTTRNPKNPWGLKTPLISDSTSSSETTKQTQQRKVSPQISRIASLPAYPTTITKSPHSKEPTPYLPKFKRDTHRCPKEEVPRLLLSSSVAPTLPEELSQVSPGYGYMSRARIQATLNSILQPYNEICPISLVSGEKCHVEGCELLNICPEYLNSLLDSSPSEKEDFPPLSGTSQHEKLSNPSDGLACAKVDGEPVGEGSICAAGCIHLKPSCSVELEDGGCEHWHTPATSTTGKKFRALNLDYNYTAPPPDLRPSPMLKTTTCMFSSNAKSRNGSCESPCCVDSKSSREEMRNTSSKSIGNTEGRDTHFKLHVHERDGVGRNVWQARVLNASLRGVHERGAWGVTPLLEELVEPVDSNNVGNEDAGEMTTSKIPLTNEIGTDELNNGDSNRQNCSSRLKNIEAEEIKAPIAWGPKRPWEDKGDWRSRPGASAGE